MIMRKRGLSRVTCAHLALAAAAALGLAAVDAGADVVVPIAIGNSTAAPGAGGGTFLGLSNDPIIDVNGFVGFQGSLTGTSDASTVGMFRWNTANFLEAIMREK